MVHFKLAQSLSPDDVALKMRNALMVPVIYENEAEIIKRRERLGKEIKSLIEEGVKIEALDEISMPGTFYLIYQGFNDRDLMMDIQKLYRSAYPKLIGGGGRVMSDVPEERKIRVGFVSSYFRRHSVCKLLCGIITNLDKTKFDVVVFSSTSDPDEYTEEIMEDPDITFINVQEGFLLKNRDLVTEQNLDVLIYPDIGMDTKTTMWAHGRLAKVQMVFWGHPATTGLETMDYFISSDAYEYSDGGNRFSEQLIRMDGLGFFFKADAVAEGMGDTMRQELNLKTR